MPALVVLALLAIGADDGGPTVRVGSKTFTESVILGEIAQALIREAGVAALHRRELGGTQVLFHALEADELDVYPEYTGTISGEILAGKVIRGEGALRAALAQRGVGMSRPLGFDDTYAIGMIDSAAARLGIVRISDLKRHPGLKLGFSNEFMDRADGWPGLRDRYGLPQRDVRGLDHDLAYRALATDEIQATELYSTDAEIKQYKLRLLSDDLGFFPSYECVWLYRTDLPTRSPAAFAAISRLEGRITAHEMAAMNARAKLDRISEERVAADFLQTKFGFTAQVVAETFFGRLLRRLGEHLALVSISLAAAIAVSIPLGIVASRATARAADPDVGRRDPDDPLAGVARIHDSLAGHRGQARACRTFSLQPAADRPQHGRGAARYSDSTPRIGRGAGVASVCAAVPDRAADGITGDLGRYQNGGGDQRRYGHDRGLDRRRRIRTADPDRYSPRRRPHDPDGRRHPRRGARPGRPGSIRSVRAIPRAARAAEPEGLNLQDRRRRWQAAV